MSSSTVREISFILPNKTIYKINSNSTVTIKSLKKIVVAAANLSYKNFKLIYNNVDYLLNYESHTVKQLFDENSKIIFQIVYEENNSAQKTIINKPSLGNICFLHPLKYIFLYCYNCKTSICSQCLQENLHENHNIIDKQEYLKSNKSIVNSILDELIDLRQKDNTKELLSKSKEKIEKELFPLMIKQATEAKNKILNNLEIFEEILSKSSNNLVQGLNNFESSCIQFLDELDHFMKKEISLVDEIQFLSFDSKVSAIRNRKVEIIVQTDMSEKLSEKVKAVSENLTISYEKLCERVKFSEENLNNNIIMNNLLLKEKPLSLEEAYELLYKDYTKESEYNTPVKKSLYEKENVLNYSINCSSIGKNSILDNIISTIHNESVFKSKSFNTPFKESENLTTLINEPKEEPKKKIRSLYTIVPKSTRLIEYNFERDKLTEINLKFSSFIGICHFLLNSSSVNDGKHLYISGGFLEKDSNSFLMFNSQNLVRLPAMLYSRSNHSLIKINNLIYSIGGVRNKTCELFNCNEIKWNYLPNLNMAREKSNLLLINSSYLYCFLGKNDNPKVNLEIERLHLRDSRAWELLNFVNDDNINLKIYGSCLFPLNRNEIILFGGKSEDNEYNKKVILLNINRRIVNKIGENQGEYYFMENDSHFIGKNSYANYNSVNNNIIYFDMEKFYQETQQFFYKYKILSDK